VLWIAAVGVSGWQLEREKHDKPALAFVILGAICLFLHMLLLFTYWLRFTLRKQQARQLPTQASGQGWALSFFIRINICIL
jgi:hypothetical protein